MINKGTIIIFCTEESKNKKNDVNLLYSTCGCFSEHLKTTKIKKANNRRTLL